MIIDKHQDEEQQPKVKLAKLPVSRKVLEAFRRIPVANDASSRSRAIQTILNEALLLKSSTSAAEDEESEHNISKPLPNAAKLKSDEVFLYIVKRILNGVSVSRSRYNYTVLLMTMLRLLTNVPDYIKKISNTAYLIYSKPEQFNSQREYQLGILAILTCFAKYHQCLPVIHKDFFRLVFILLKNNKSNNKSNNNEKKSYHFIVQSTIIIISSICEHSSKFIKLNVSQLLAYCEANKKLYTGLSLSLTLLQHKCITNDQFSNLYDFQDHLFENEHVTSALLACFATDYSLFDRVSINGSGSGSDNTNQNKSQTDIIPMCWKLVLNYLRQQRNFNIYSFWTHIFTDTQHIKKDAEGSSSLRATEKKIFMVQLLSYLITNNYIDTKESFDSIFFDKELLEMIQNIVMISGKKMKSKTNHQQKLQMRTNARLRSSLNHLFIQIFTHFNTKETDSGKGDKTQLQMGFWRWIIENHFDSSHMSEEKVLETSMQSITSDKQHVQDILNFFIQSIVKILSKTDISPTARNEEETNKSTIDKNKNKLTEMQVKKQQMINCMKLLWAFSDNYKLIKNDIIRLTTLYSMFHGQEEGTTKKSVKSNLFQWDILKVAKKNTNNDSLVDGYLPNAELNWNGSLKLQQIMCDSLVSNLNKDDKKDNDEDEEDDEHTTSNMHEGINVCLDVIQKALKSGMGMSSVNDEKELKKRTCLRYFEVIDSLEKAVKNEKNEEHKAIYDALKLTASYLTLDLVKIKQYKNQNRTEEKNEAEEKNKAEKDEGENEDDENTDDKDKSMAVYESYIELSLKLEECQNSMSDSKEKDDEKMEESEGVVEADPNERLTHLICDIRGREHVDLTDKMTGNIISSLGKFVDDRVIAVLFDSLDAYSSGIERLGDSFVVDDSEEDETEENDEEKKEEEDDGDDVDMEDEDEESDEEDEKIGNKAKQDNSASGDDDDTDNGEEDSDEEDEMNMDLDDEDPKLLEALDKRLSMHMKLVKQDRKDKSKNKKKSAAELLGLIEWREKQLLWMVGYIVRLIRKRIVQRKSDSPSDVETKEALMCLDIMVRTIEYRFNSEEAEEGETDETQSSNKINFIILNKLILKHIVQSQSSISNVLKDNNRKDVQDILKSMMDRLFESVGSCMEYNHENKQNSKEAQENGLSKATWLLTHTYMELSNGSITYKDICNEYYKPLVEKMLNGAGDSDNKKKTGSIWSKEICNSFISRSDEVNGFIGLIDVIDESFKNKTVFSTKHGQVTASELCLSMAFRAKQLQQRTNNGGAKDEFSSKLVRFVERELSDSKQVKQSYKPAVALNFAKAVGTCAVTKENEKELNERVKDVVLGIFQKELKVKKKELEKSFSLQASGKTEEAEEDEIKNSKSEKKRLPDSNKESKVVRQTRSQKKK